MQLKLFASVRQTLYGNPVLVQLECVTSLVVLGIAYVFIVIEDKGVLEKELTQTPTITWMKTCKPDFDMTQIEWWGIDSTCLPE